MKKRTLTIIVSLLLLTFLGSAGASFGEDIKARMKGRLSAIKALKAQGIVGENKDGYLEFLGQKKNEDIVNAENTDRGKVYRAIAKQQGTTSELVGKRRALQIAGKAQPGEWVQDNTGAWRQVK